MIIAEKNLTNKWLSEQLGVGQATVSKWVQNNAYINYSKLKQYFIPVPPLEEQKQIIDYIQSRNVKIDVLAEKLQQEIDCIKEYKQRLVADVITGQMKIC